MVHYKTPKLVLDGRGSFMGMEKSYFIVKDKHRNAE
jgi:hypothetical protein